MDKFIALFFSGLALGAIYTLVALGILILFKATGVVNAALVVGENVCERTAK